MFFVVLVFSFIAGLLGARWWVGLLLMAASLAVGVYMVVTEPPNYDMPGFGYGVGVAVAVLAGVLFVAGRGLRRLSARR